MSRVTRVNRHPQHSHTAAFALLSTALLTSATEIADAGVAATSLGEEEHSDFVDLVDNKENNRQKEGLQESAIDDQLIVDLTTPPRVNTTPALNTTECNAVTVCDAVNTAVCDTVDTAAVCDTVDTAPVCDTVDTAPVCDAVDTPMCEVATDCVEPAVAASMESAAELIEGQQPITPAPEESAVPATPPPIGVMRTLAASLGPWYRQHKVHLAMATFVGALAILGRVVYKKSKAHIQAGEEQ